VNTFTSFQALRKRCIELDAAFIAAYSTWRTQLEILNQKAVALNEANIAWYAAATRIFPAGTAEGDMIRRSIPTVYLPPVPAEPPAPAPQPQPAAAMQNHEDREDCEEYRGLRGVISRSGAGPKQALFGASKERRSASTYPKGTLSLAQTKCFFSAAGLRRASARCHCISI
jgi:hypothetical protein